MVLGTSGKIREHVCLEEERRELQEGIGNQAEGREKPWPWLQGVSTALLKPGTSSLQEGMRVVWEEIRALGFSPVAKQNSVS